MDQLLKSREAAYLELLQLRQPVEQQQQVSAAQAVTGGINSAANKVFGGLWGGRGSKSQPQPPQQPPPPSAAPR